MGFMISFDGRATLTSDERHSTRDIELMGGTIDTKKKNTINARAPPILLKNLHKTVEKIFLSIEIIDKNPTTAPRASEEEYQYRWKFFLDRN